MCAYVNGQNFPDRKEISESFDPTKFSLSLSSINFSMIGKNLSGDIYTCLLVLKFQIGDEEIEANN